MERSRAFAGCEGPFAALTGTRVTLVIVLSAISLFGLAPVAPASEKPSVRTEMLVSTEWLGAHLSEPKVIVLCIASDEFFYSEGHIPGSRLVLLSEITTLRDSIPNELPSVEKLRSVFERVGVTNASRLVLYGERSGLLAARAYFTLDYLGVADRAALLDGGMEKWRGEQRPESKSVPSVTKSKLDVQVNSSVLVTADELKTMLETPQHNVTLIDARPAAEYGGDRLSEDVSHAGHIPDAEHLYWKDLVVEGDIPALRPASQLQALLRNAGADHRQAVISYCRTGMRSSLDYFVAKYLGYTSRMYDALSMNGAKGICRWKLASGTRFRRKTRPVTSQIDLARISDNCSLLPRG